MAVRRQFPPFSATQHSTSALCKGHDHQSTMSAAIAPLPPLTDRTLRIVAACCRPVSAPDRGAAISAAAAHGFEADRLVALTRAHRVEGLVVHGLAEAGISLPPESAAALAQRAGAARLAMVRNAGEEIRLSGLLQEAGIRATFIKGATLAMLAHRSIGLKASCDIDVLVDRADIGRAIAVLRAAGYECSEDAIVAAGFAERFAATARETRWLNHGRLTTVDLHWHLAENPALLKELSAHAPQQTVELAAGRRVPTLAMPDLFVFLAVHGTGHGWCRLKWLADFAALADANPAHLDAWLAHADRMGALRPAATGMMLARDLLGVAVPAAIEPVIANTPQARALAAFSLRAMQRLANADSDPFQRITHKLELNRMQMAMAPDLHTRWAGAWSKLAQPRTLRRLRLPAWMRRADALLVALPAMALRSLPWPRRTPPRHRDGQDR